jgi:mannose-6-phosphate isomerase
VTIELPPNLLQRFYCGGPRIAAFRGLSAGRDDTPEDWVASTTTAYGEGELGLSSLADGRRLVDVFARDPETFFEPAHLERFGADPTLLIKFLDAGERLPVHLHPDDAFALAHFGAKNGKTEAWIILEAEPDACVHVGFARELDEREVGELVDAQDAGAMLSEMNRMAVAAGDWIFVPAGLPHAIGAGILLLELQQPADFSLLLEGGEFLGLPRELALTAVDRSPPDLEGLRQRPFPSEVDRFFRAELVVAGERLEPGYSVLVGFGGNTVLIPYADGEISAPFDAIRCRPPLP